MHFCSELILRSAVAGALGTFALSAAAVTEDSPAPHAVSVVRADSKTGRLIRTVVVKGKPAPGKAPAALRSLVEETARNHDVSPLLVDSVIQVESNYNPYAVSPKGAQGLMQLMPATARRFGVTEPFDAKQNIEAGVKYLKLLQDTFKDERLAIAAYNAGEGAVGKYGDVPPYRETQEYVQKVGQLSKAKQAESKIETSAKLADAEKPADDETRHVVQFKDAEGRLHLTTQ